MNRSHLVDLGFQGFVPVSQLRTDISQVPEHPGVYAVVRHLETGPSFLQKSIGGWFKRKNPSVTVSRLEAKWVHGTQLLYFGRAANIEERIESLLKFGQGEPIGHWGGRFLWQVENSDSFDVCWKETPGRDPFEVERELMEEFKEAFGSWPFANTQAPRRQRRGS